MNTTKQEIKLQSNSQALLITSLCVPYDVNMIIFNYNDVFVNLNMKVKSKNEPAY